MKGSESMKVVYILGTFPVLSQTFIYHEILSHVGSGHDVEIISLKRPKDPALTADWLENLNRRVHYLDVPRRVTKVRRYCEYLILLARSGLRSSLFKKLLEGRAASSYPQNEVASYRLARFWINRQIEPDIVHCHFGPQGLAAARLKGWGLISAPLITTFHGTDLSQHLQKRGPRTYSILFAHGDLFLAVNQEWVTLLEELGCPRDRIVKHWLGVDCKNLQYRERQTLEGRPPRLVSVGRLVEKKGHHLTIEALGALVARRRNLAFKLDIIGDGPNRKHLAQLIDKYGLGEVVQLHGAMPHEEVCNFLEEADIFVLPSQTASDGGKEGIPISIMEAMAMGLPVVSSRHSGIPELVEDGVSGLLVEEGDVAALETRLEMMISNPDRWAHMGSAGRLKVETCFDHEISAGRLRECYEAALASRRVSPLQPLECCS